MKTSGGQCVIIPGRRLMPQSCVHNWTYTQFRYVCVYQCVFCHQTMVNKGQIFVRRLFGKSDFFPNFCQYRQWFFGENVKFFKKANFMFWGDSERYTHKPQGVTKYVSVPSH